MLQQVLSFGSVSKQKPSSVPGMACLRFADLHIVYVAGVVSAGPAGVPQALGVCLYLHDLFEPKVSENKRLHVQTEHDPPCQKLDYTY